MNRKDLFYLIAISFLAFFFYTRLFIPTSSLFFTPDLGRSDIFHYNFAKKYLLSQSLKQGIIPLWTDKVGTGASLIGEGQIGAFSLVNLIIYFLFSPVVAFNLSYPVYALIAAGGMYFLGRFLKFSRFVSFFTSVVFSFSGFFLFRVTHTNIFHAAVYVPWIFLFVLRIWEQQKLIDILLLAIFFSQQISAGHFQIPVLTSMSVVIFLLVLFSSSNIREFKTAKKIIYIGSGLFFGFLLSAVVWLPQMELAQISQRSNELEFSRITANSFSPRLLPTLVWPFILGTPKDASYTLGDDVGFDIFWEKMGYIGIAPLLLFLYAVFVGRKEKKAKQKYQKSFVLLFIASLFLSFGKYSPIFFVYMLPPLKYFRNPARLLFIADFSLAILTGYGLQLFLEKIKTKINPVGILYLKFLLFIVVYLPALYILYSYHPVVAAEKILTVPKTGKFLSEKKGRIYQVGGGWPYMQKLLTQGWENKAYYIYALNNLDANLGLVYGFSQVNIYDGLMTRQQAKVQKILQSKVVAETKKMIATPSAEFKQILNSASVKYLVSPFRFIDNDFELIKMIAPEKIVWENFYIYENLSVLPRARLAEGKGVAEIINSKEEKVTVEVESKQKDMLILADSYYPGWKAYLDGSEVNIKQAGINQRKVAVPAGRHEINFVYKPESYKLGKRISLVAWGSWEFLGVLLLSIRLWTIRKTDA